eukprot:TRINITY_DN78481_c0_g1_i1.p1 TRINITY_DN78481_c0_g1~~TRINITY_DN78481_c0_g1_i1.p1  ORF type:complete len:575 (+),score=145.21 TRINITY_DN78481_c0_g1_i1:187-1725(+)
MQAIGEQLYGIISQVHPELAPKLTGMLLQLGEDECWACVENEEKLALRLDEALRILDGHEGGQQDGKQQSAPAAASAASREERRVDPGDGVARTLRELRDFYRSQYSAKEVEEYWQCCTPESSCAKPKPAAVRTSTADARPQPTASRPRSENPEPLATKHVQAVAKPKPAPGRPAPSAPAQESKLCTNALTKGPPGLASACDVVPGLSAWLTELRLNAYIEAAGSWAEENGAVSLDELLENLEDLAADLKFKPLELKRIKEQGAAAAEAVSTGAAAAPAAHDDEEQQEQEDDDVDALGADELNEVRAMNLDVERDFAELSRFDRPESEDFAEPPRPAPKPRVQPAARAPAVEQRQVHELKAALACAGRPEALPAEERRIDPEDGQARTLSELHTLYAGKFSGPEIDEYWQECQAIPVEERRVDPEDGQARTLKEFHAFWSGTFLKEEIEEYWQECEPAGATPAPEPPQTRAAAAGYSAPASALTAVSSRRGDGSGGGSSAGGHWGAGSKLKF